MSLARGVPKGVVAAVITGEDRSEIWRVVEGPLGWCVEPLVFGFGLLPPDQVHCSWWMHGGGLAMGVGGGWVVVGVGGEVRARVGGGVGGPCHAGALTDLILQDPHLYTVGSDGWLRVWESEPLHEAALRA
ncbi:hypothetical protein Pmani_032974, partial [Petrolisthes manimaculis]